MRRYKVNFVLEGAVEIDAPSEEEARDMVEEMERDRLLSYCQEQDFSTSAYELEEE